MRGFRPVGRLARVDRPYPGHRILLFEQRPDVEAGDLLFFSPTAVGYVDGVRMRHGHARVRRVDDVEIRVDDDVVALTSFDYAYKATALGADAITVRRRA